MKTITLSDTECDMIRTALWQHVHPSNMASEKYSNLARRFRVTAIPSVLVAEPIEPLPYTPVRVDLVAVIGRDDAALSAAVHDLVDGRYQPARGPWDDNEAVRGLISPGPLDKGA